MQILFHLLIVCLSSGHKIEEHHTIIHYLHMKTEKGTVTTYPQAVNEVIIHQFLAIRQFIDILSIHHLLNRFTYRLQHLSGKFTDSLLKLL